MKDANQIRADRLHARTLHCSYNYCGICGRTPKSNDEPNYAPLRWWDPDDGWKIGTLCHWCHDEVVKARPNLDPAPPTSKKCTACHKKAAA